MISEDNAAAVETVAEDAAEPTAPVLLKATERLRTLLANWTTVAEISSELGWQAHSVRGAISTLSKKGGASVEKRKVVGVTQYRIVS